MKVLIATEHFPPFIGGAHRWSDLISSGLAARGHEVAVATTWHGGLPQVERHGPHHVPVHRVRQLRTAVPWLVRDRRQRHAPPFPDPVSVYQLRRLVRRLEPQVVLAHGWLAYSMVAALQGTDVPVALSAHDYGYFCATRRLLHDGRPCDGPAPVKCLTCAGDYYGVAKGAAAVAGVGAWRPLLVHRMNGLHSVTTFVEERLRRHLLGGRSTGIRLFVIPPFLQDDGEGTSQAEVRRHVEQLPSEPFILFAGAFRADKGLQVLFDAYVRLQDPPRLVLMGTMERDTPPFPSGAIVLTDVPHAAVIAAMDRARMVVVPSLLPEPLGTVAVEGISQGAPTIVTAPGGMQDVVADGAGVLVPQGDAGALADAMRSILDDEQLSRALSRAGRARAEQYKAEAVLGRYERMLAELAAAGGA